MSEPTTYNLFARNVNITLFIIYQMIKQVKYFCFSSVIIVYNSETINSIMN